MSSNLYRYGSSTAQTVTITSDANRDLGMVDVVEMQEPVDVSNDFSRELGKVVVDNTLTTDLSAALSGDALRTVLDAVGIEDATGTRIDPATDGGLQAIRDALTKGPLATDATLADAVSRLANVDGSTAAATDAATNASGISQGRATVTTAGTAVSLTGGTATPVGAGKSVAVQAMPDTDGLIYVGDATTDASTGYPLQAGQVVTLAVDDVATITIDADTAGDGVAWIVEAE